MDLPTTNGHDAVDEPAPEGRDPATGRFVKGNACGRGHGRSPNRYRAAVVEAVTEADLRAVVRSMVKAARGGDVAAAKLVLSYTVGKPVEVEEIDDGGDVEQEFAYL